MLIRNYDGTKRPAFYYYYYRYRKSTISREILEVIEGLMDVRIVGK